MKKSKFNYRDKDDIVIQEQKIKGYFKKCIDSRIAPTKIGILNTLGITKQNLEDAKKNKNLRPYYDLIKKYYLEVRQIWTEALFENIVGRIFYLKSSFGMQENDILKSFEQNKLKIKLVNESGIELNNEKKRK